MSRCVLRAMFTPANSRRLLLHSLSILSPSRRQVEGHLNLREVGEGGTTTYKLCLEKVTLWSKEADSESCPRTLEFNLTLPTTFSDDKDTYVSVR